MDAISECLTVRSLLSNSPICNAFRFHFISNFSQDETKARTFGRSVSLKALTCIIIPSKSV